jgi:membrane associated rhomboid family serine protease
MFVQRGLNSNTVVFNLIMINVLAFMASWIAGYGVAEICGQEHPVEKATYYFGLYLPGSDLFRPWQLLTHFFLHGSFWHLFFNMYALWMFGNALEQLWGPKKFLTYYMITAMGAAACHIGARYLQYRGIDAVSMCFVENTPAIGASGAVFGILLAYGMLFPNTELFLMFFPVPIKAKYFVIGYGVIELAMVVRNSPGDQVAHFAHLGGMLFGFIMIMLWKKDKNHFY